MRNAPVLEQDGRLRITGYVQRHAIIAGAGEFGSIEAAARYAATMQAELHGNAGSVLITDDVTGNVYLLLDLDGDRHFETGVILEGCGDGAADPMEIADALCI